MRSVESGAEGGVGQRDAVVGPIEDGNLRRGAAAVFARDVRHGVVEERDAAATRQRLAAAESSHDDARDAHTRAQVDRAQIEARLQVANDRERRLEQEAEHAASRLQALRSELADLSQSDSAIAERMAGWRMDLETREAALADGDSHLIAAERRPSSEISCAVASE